MSFASDRLTALSVAGSIALSVGVVGAGYLYFRSTGNAHLMERDRMLHEIEKLRLEVEQLRVDVLRAESSSSTSVIKNDQTFRRQRSVTFDTEQVSSSSPSVPPPSYTPRKPTLIRATSYNSITSDGDYASAEEEWDDGTITIPCLDDPSRPSIRIPSISFDDVDRLFGTDDIQTGYDSLKKRYDGADKANVEVLWRLAKFCHELAGRAEKNKRKDIIFEGKKYAEEALAVNDKMFLAAKWAAVMTGLATDYMGTKEKIEQGAKFKEYLDLALSMDAKEYSLLHMRGRYAHSVASLSWLERKAASVLFATPPTATYDEALTDFLAAYDQKPDWIENLVFVARCYLQKSDKANAKKFLSLALKVTPLDDCERDLIQEATKMLSKC